MIHHRNDKDVPWNQLLTSYMSTPHPATGETPRSILFRSGYMSEFPQNKLPDERIQAAFDLNQTRKLERSHSINASKHRLPSAFQIGDQVYMRNLRCSKFHLTLGPDTFTVVSLHAEQLQISPVPQQHEACSLLIRH